ncbi:MAG TPA: methyltransferase domain-containing protein [Clostridiales bacterium]|nr:methyltransferase domain-containing protein [Clostridiales bacterium]
MSENGKNSSQKGSKVRVSAGKIKIKENIDIFKCPVCGDGMYVDEFKSIICMKNHCFDISRRGYVNLLLKPPKHKYGKELFKSRSVICQMGFFDPLLESIVRLIYDNISDDIDHVRILDAGCGEGYHLSQVIKKLQENQDTHFQGVGIDISKDAIQIASKNFKGIVWCVADIAKIPFMDKKFDIVLNILSPSNYSEFSRIIRSQGVLIKIVPNSGYLKELRDIFYRGTDKEIYSNEEVIEHFSKNFEVLDTKNVQYSVSLNREQLSHLIKMTPLSWGAAEEIIEKALDSNIDNITADFTVIVGRGKLSN